LNSKMHTLWTICIAVPGEITLGLLERSELQSSIVGSNSGAFGAIKLPHYALGWSSFMALPYGSLSLFKTIFWYFCISAGTSQT